MSKTYLSEYIMEKKVLCVIPARGGSKGIKLKNLRVVCGATLLSHAVKTALACPEISETVVSTDHDDIALEAEASGIKMFFRRPKHLSGDLIGDFDVLLNALDEAESHFKTKFDIIVMLQPTSPLRTPKDVRDAIEHLITKEYDSVWSVSETDSKYHPLKQLSLDESGAFDYFDPNSANIIARQQLTALFHRNGVVYAFTRDCLVKQKSIKGKKSGALLIEGHHISIDTEEDIEIIENLVRIGKVRDGILFSLK